jgi:RNA polymerase sigma-70 factor (ECF subfamily)
MEPQQERALAQALRQGQAEAWRTLYDTYAEQVWRFVARRMGPAAADIADVVQETFLAAARSAPSYDPGRGTVWTWLSGIARNHVALYYRKQSRHARVRQAGEWLAAGNGQIERWLEGGGEAPPALLDAAELATLVRATLTELPEDYESLLAAKYLDGQPVEEIAGHHRSTVVAIRSKLARARRAFREAFLKHADVEEVTGVERDQGMTNDEARMTKE